MSHGNLHVLILDRSDEDAAPAVTALRQEGYELEWERVAAVTGCEQAIVDGEYDVVLAEFRFPGFAFGDVLRITRENRLDVPVIVVTANESEEAVADAIRAGARDVVAKQQLARLGPAVAREMADVRARRLRRGAEAELEAQHRRFQALLTNSVEAIGVLDPEGTTLYSSPCCTNVIGYAPEELVGRNALEFVAPEETPIAAAALQRVRESPGGIERAIVRVRHRDGTLRWVEICGLNLTQDPAVRGVVINYHDVSDRVRQDRQIRRLNRVYAALLQLNRMLDAAASAVDACRAACEILHRTGGFTVACIRRVDPVTGALTILTLAANDPAATLPVLALAGDRLDGQGPSAEAVRTGRTCVQNDFESDPLLAPVVATAQQYDVAGAIAIPVRLEEGASGVLTVYASERGVFGDEEVALLEGAAAELSRTIAHFAEIAASREAERRIRHQAELLDKANEAIVVTDVDGRITFWNHGAERVFGRTAAEVLGRSHADLLAALGIDPGSDGCMAANAGNDWRGELRGRRTPEQPFVVDLGITVLRGVNGERTGLLIVSTDITEKKQVEEQFLRTQRLDSIGMLAAGISHDLNNLLAPVGMVATVLRSRLHEAADLRLLDTLENSAQRGAGLVRQIVAFANGGSSEFSLVQPKHILRELAGMVTETFPRSIVLEDFIPSDLWPVNANPTQLHQVVLNLCVNARDAMPNGGTLRLRAENRSVTGDDSAAPRDVPPGLWVALHVEDTGTGIAPEIAERVWEPFFTAKGNGNGLGLSTARSIVRVHHGVIGFTSQPGQGTVFHVYLPAVPMPETADRSVLPVSSRGRGELVLVADDEESVLRTAAAVLDQAGYRVLAARDGAAALELIAKHASELALVVTDLDMPSVGGADVAKVAMTIRSDLKVLAISGLGAVHGDGRAEVTANFLPKPFTGVQLLSAVELLLKGTPIPPTVFEASV